MPLQNRVNPFGELFATPARGTLFGNRGGRFHTDADAHGLTIVPGRFHFSLDVRAYDEAVLAALEHEVDALIAGIEQRRGVHFHRGASARAAVGSVDPAIKAALLEGAAALSTPVLELGSPASHDAAAFAAALRSAAARRCWRGLTRSDHVWDCRRATPD